MELITFSELIEEILTYPLDITEEEEQYNLESRIEELEEFLNYL